MQVQMQEVREVISTVSVSALPWRYVGDMHFGL